MFYNYKVLQFIFILYWGKVFFTLICLEQSRQIGKWSDISVYEIPFVELLVESDILLKILFIRVAELSVTRVGLLIDGRNELENITSKNDEVAACVSLFNKLILRLKTQTQNSLYS